MIDIVEIISRSEEGRTRPFICRGSNDEIFYVKGKYAGRRSLFCEWLAGNLALMMGLPIAPFQIVEVPRELVMGAPPALSAQHLGIGPAFGSVRQQVSRIQYSQLNGLPMEQMLEVLAFDYWVRNQDRTLTEKSGNPNLFWNPNSERLVVLDHNLAFDPEFNHTDFFAYHVFCRAKSLLGSSQKLRLDLIKRMKFALSYWEEFLKGIPFEWNFIDEEQTIVVDDIDIKEIYASLESAIQRELWLS